MDHTHAQQRAVLDTLDTLLTHFYRVAKFLCFFGCKLCVFHYYPS
jgi:hypothetical protein